MAAEQKDLPAPTAASLVVGILSDLQLLVEQQFQLTRCEIEDELRLRTAAAAVLGAGIAGCFLSAMMLSMALAHGLHWAMSPNTADSAALPLWICEAGISVLLGSTGAWLAVTGRRRFNAVTASQNPAREIFEESEEWKTDSP